MKFSLPKETLLDELQLLQGIVEKRNTMPILANILMTVSESEVELTGTDLEVGLRTHFAADIQKPGAITVNGKKIFEIVKSLPDGQTVSVELKGETIEITAGESEFKILCMAEGGLSAGARGGVREGNPSSLGRRQGHDRPGLLRDHAGAAVLPERRAAAPQEQAHGAREHGRPPAVLHVQGGRRHPASKRT